MENTPYKYYAKEQKKAMQINKWGCYLRLFELHLRSVFNTPL